MDDSAQYLIPESFQALFGAPGRRRSASREHIVERHDFCEDLAQMLTETCRELQHRDGLPDDLVLERVAQGLQPTVEGGSLSADEARWVLRRSAELLGWPWPADPDGRESTDP